MALRRRQRIEDLEHAVELFAEAPPILRLAELKHRKGCPKCELLRYQAGERKGRPPLWLTER